MLVLVLILVVIALVLLLAGWFLHLVVLAWTSVGISVLAGLVLLYDWWQTRSAVRAGRQVAGQRGTDGDRDRTVAVGGSAPGAAGPDGYPASGPGSPDAGYVEADMEPATQVLPVVPPSANAAEQTVVMPVVAPSGSPEEPSGVSRSSGILSRSVTDTTADDGGTTAVDPAAAPVPGGGDPVNGTAHDTARVSGAETAGAVRAPDADGTAVVGSAAGQSAHSGQSTTRVPSEPDATSVVPADDGATRATRVDAADDPTALAAAPDSDDDRTRAAAPVDTSGEAPEEPRDATLAALVARLPDEVVVIDEHPRYHVQNCPSLAGQALIPLPVSEAVELGFTPCGWCSPNRALGERYPAEVR